MFILELLTLGLIFFVELFDLLLKLGNHFVLVGLLLFEESQVLVVSVILLLQHVVLHLDFDIFDVKLNLLLLEASLRD